MNITLYSLIGIIIPFIGTSFGSSFVLILKKNLNEKIQKLILGFAGGVMIAASIWSLIIPSAELAEEQNIINWLPASLGFIFGIFFLIITNKIADKLAEKRNRKKLNMLMLSVTLHNIPEGMAVGVCFAGLLAGNTGISLVSAMALSIGIALQNIPEGAIISIPLKLQGMSKIKALLYGVISGIVEPIAAILTLMLINIVIPLLPYLLSFAAGAMIYVVVEELVPEMHSPNKSVLGVIGIAIGFVMMMIMDMAL